jgi:hypothetical protein
MGAVSTCPAFLDALRAALVLRAGLSGVNIFTAGVDQQSAGTEHILLGLEAIETDGEYETMPMAEVSEEYDVDGFSWVQKPGAGETVIKAARDRAFALLEEVSDYLTSVNTSTAATVAALGVDDARLTGWKLEQFPMDGTRDARLTFTIHVQARFLPA